MAAPGSCKRIEKSSPALLPFINQGCLGIHIFKFHPKVTPAKQSQEM